MTRTFIGIYVTGLFLISCSTQSETSEFDKVCGYFQELGKQPNVNSMTHLQRNDFILEKLRKNLKDTSNARIAWEAISNAVAEQRYELFKSAAESEIHETWHCNAMEKLAHKTGEF